MAQEDCPDLAIVKQPESLTTCYGETVTLSVVATGDPSLNYQWRRNCIPILGATDPTLIIDAVEESDYATYTVEVADSCGVLTSNQVTLSPDQIYYFPGDDDLSFSLCDGATFDFNFGTVQGKDLNYEWRLNCSQVVANTESASLDLSSISFADGDFLDLIVYNSCSSVTLNSVQLFNDPNSINIIQQPQDQEVCFGDTATFTIQLAPFVYDIHGVFWRRGEITFDTQDPFELSIRVDDIDKNGIYQASVYTQCGYFASLPAQLDIRIDCGSDGSDFRNWMINGNWQFDETSLAIDANSSNTVTLSEAQQVNGLIDLSNTFLTNYEGLQYFGNLVDLDLSRNGLSSVPDLSALGSLEALTLNYNGLEGSATALFNSVPTFLETLNFQGNQLDEMPSLAQFDNLGNLDLSYNHLSDLGTFLSDTTLGDFAADVIDVRYNFLDCDAINGLLELTAQSGATFLYNPQYNLPLFARWQDRDVDIRHLIHDLGQDLTCTGP